MNLELNKIYNENCLQTMLRMDDCVVDLTVTSPPYDKVRSYNGFSFPFRHIAKQLFRVTKEGGVVVWVVGDQTINGSESLTSFKQALFFVECGFRLHDTQIYKKQNFIPLTHNRYEQEFEYMFVFSKGRPKTFNPIKVPTKDGGKVYNFKRRGHGFQEGAVRRRDEVIVTQHERIAGNIFSYGTGNSGVNHPAVFPKQLAIDQIKTWSNEGDVVYDSFGGSGTVAEVSHLLRRGWILSEISSEYASDAQKRILPLLNQMCAF